MAIPPPQGFIPLEEYNAMQAVSALPPPPAGFVPVDTLKAQIGEEAFRTRYGSLGENLLQGVKDAPMSLLNTPQALIETGSGLAGAVGNVVSGEQVTPENLQAVRNVGTLAGATSGGMLGGAAGLKAGALLGSFGGPVGTAVGGGVGTLLGGALGAGLGALGINYFAEQDGVDAPRTTQERLNSLAYDTGNNLAGDVLMRGAGAGIARAADPMRKMTTAAGQTEVAANVLANNLGENPIAKMIESQKGLEGDPLAQYRTTGELVGTEAAAQLQKQVETAGFGSAVGENAVQRAEARKNLLAGLTPETTPSIEAVQQALSENIDAARQTAITADSALPSNIDPTVAGAAIRDLAEQLYGKQRERVDTAFASIPDMGAARFTPSKELMSAPEKLAQLFGPGSEGAPSELRRMIETLDPKLKASDAVPMDATAKLLQDARGETPAPVQDPKLSLEYLQRLRRWGGEAATKAFNKGENRAGSVASNVVKDIDQILDGAIESGTMTEAQGKAYRSALKAHSEMMNTFERGPMGRILTRGAGTEGYNIEPSQVGRQFWNSNPEAMKNFAKAMGGEATAGELLARDAVTDFRKSASLDGVFEPKRVANWVKDHEPFLQAFPEIKQNIDAIYEAEGLAALQNKTFGKFIDANPEHATSILMSGKDSRARASLLKSQLMDRPELLDGVRRGAIDALNNKLYSIADLDAKPNAFKNWMQQNESFLNEIMEPKQLQALDSLYKDLASDTRLEELARRASKSNSVTAQKMSLGDDLKGQILSEFGLLGQTLNQAPAVGGIAGGAIGTGIGGWMIGGTTGTVVGAQVGGKVRFLVERAQRAALSELGKAMADPEFAALLLTKTSPSARAKAMKILEPKLNPIRRMFISGAAATKEDEKKAAGELAELFAPTADTPLPQPASPTDRGLMQLASLMQNGGGGVLQRAPAFTMGDAMTERKPSSRLDPALVDAVIWQESRGKPSAVGPQTKYGRAKGLMQLLDSTGEEMHKRLGLEGKYDPFNAEQNRQIGTAYLKDLAKRYNGSVPLALAAYNWGMGNLERAIERISKNGPAPIQAFLEEQTKLALKRGASSERAAKRQAAAALIDSYGHEVIHDYLPAETKNYVTRILARYEGKQGDNKVVRA